MYCLLSSSSKTKINALKSCIFLQKQFSGYLTKSSSLNHSMKNEVYHRIIQLNILTNYYHMPCCKFTMSHLHTSGKSSLLRLIDYDCIGFDLDNTLCEYKILPSVLMEYEILAKYLVNEKNYDPDYLLKPMDRNSAEFLHKGLVVDFENGNLLKLGINGIICRASHGTKFMSNEEIVHTYGYDRKWKLSEEFCTNILNAWNGPLSERMRFLLDYFDMPASLAFARIIDSLDHQLNTQAKRYNVWPDVLSGLQYMYKRENFAENTGYFKEVRENPNKFLKKCSPDLLKWLKEIKKTKITYLITGSSSDFATLVAETSLGKDWQNLFDVVVFYARKPGFFSGCRPFIRLDGFTETDPIHLNELALGNMYSQGNWQELYQLFRKELNMTEPKCLYFGDNLVQDVFTPSEYTKCDTVAVVEELNIENAKEIDLHDEAVCPSRSTSWGSYFYDENLHINTFWSEVIRNHSQLCIPSLSYLAQCSLGQELKK